MSEFKFVCPTCGQKIQVDAAVSGRQCPCPGCQATLLIPGVPKESGEIPTATLIQAKELSPQAKADGATKPKTVKPVRVEQSPAQPVVGAGSDTRLKGPIKVRAEAGPSQPPAASAAEPAAPGGTTAHKQPVQIAVLTPKVKREIIQSVRRRIANEANWMPRITSTGEFAYAAKEQEGALVPVEVTSPEATRFSVLGAVLLELQLRNVTQTATGRAEFLDDELLDALRQVAGDATAEASAAAGEPPRKGKEVPPISHAQSLAALDWLEERYTQGVEASREGGKGKLDDLRLKDVTLMIKRKIPVTTEQLCSALSNELAEVNERLTDLERSPSS